MGLKMKASTLRRIALANLALALLFWATLQGASARLRLREAG
jgi:hypothetical protein